MIALPAARLLCVLTVLVPVALALQPTRAAATAGSAASPLVDANASDVPVVRLGMTDRLFLRGADLAIVNAGACALLAQAERRECLERLSGDMAPPLRPAASPSPH
jgi:hypothetical protein